MFAIKVFTAFFLLLNFSSCFCQTIAPTEINGKIIATTDLETTDEIKTESYSLDETSTTVDKGGIFNFTPSNFMLWTRENRENGDFIDIRNSDEFMENFVTNSLKKTYFLFHGFGKSGDDWWILEVKREILLVEDANIVSVNYSNVVNYDEYYSEAVLNGFQVAKDTAHLIDLVIENMDLNPEEIHLIGYSFGAHIAGLTGKYATNGKIGRITGLDPGGGDAYYRDPEDRLYKTQANFVDVIHTNGGFLSDNRWGLFTPVGHADFYPNGGQHQPGCNPFMELIIDCSHSRAPKYFIESISQPTKDSFYAISCPNVEALNDENCTIQNCSSTEDNSAVMGFHATSKHQGIYYLRTSDSTPFSLGRNGTLPAS